MGRGKALTLYVRGRAKPYATLARSAQRAPHWGEVARAEIELTPPEGVWHLRQAADMLR